MAVGLNREAQADVQAHVQALAGAVEGLRLATAHLRFGRQDTLHALMEAQATFAASVAQWHAAWTTIMAPHVAGASAPVEP